ncbi:uncharacterized protein NDAI_0H03470 [Naumovozyma dairenensis CBS 421]|uniref:Impact N-terminal domain-containing protein n=1 Tax=Naumovozyma dairenensis (strain ATCC 10597 / BCRC 20456 / CBS 421 / NBRC 0211 / NRRL Y-12639) TaxID=1071378 RepID=G0WFF9_NAUDC|nr:hypothetical protein NDAI_0H03470 [Naumovozyma dairenensis CBS 421]CCD26520.1 hypothetical protein NDAI_0H03470 [Naumovozyma dairenensis CBS 421]
MIICKTTERLVSNKVMNISWNESAVLIDRKSKFQARCCRIKNQNDIPILLQNLINTNKNVSKASHIHMFAWRTGELSVQSNVEDKAKSKRKNTKKKTHDHPNDVIKNIQQGSSDCGEAGAGQRLLTLLERSNIVNVLVIVTRWYGGTPLGSARFRHISSTAVESLKKGGFLT